MTNPPENIICSWSGGKDSCFALMTAVKQGHRPVALLNVLNENGQISRSHGLPPSLLEQQAAALGLPVLLQPATWKEYEAHFVQSLCQLKSTYHATAAVFGDIDLQPHRDWEEKVCSAAGLTALLPLWQQERKVLVYRMLEQGLNAASFPVILCWEKISLAGKWMTYSSLTLKPPGWMYAGKTGSFIRW